MLRDMADLLDHDWCVQQLSIMLHVFIYALRVIPGGNQVDGLPPALSGRRRASQKLITWGSKFEFFLNIRQFKSKNLGFVHYN